MTTASPPAQPISETSHPATNQVEQSPGTKQSQSESTDPLAAPTASTSDTMSPPETPVDETVASDPGTSMAKKDTSEATKASPNIPEAPESSEQVDPASIEENQSSTLANFTAAVDKMDENIDDAFGAAADTLWSFASSFSGRVSAAVSEKPSLPSLPAMPDMNNLSISSLRENVSSKLGPLDSIGRDLSSHLSSLGPPTDITTSVKSVAQSVQRNAQAMEKALLAKANGSSAEDGDPTTATERTEEEKKRSESAARAAVLIGVDGIPSTDISDGIDYPAGDAATQVVLPAAVEKEFARFSGIVGSSIGKTEKELARVGEMVGNSLGKTVGGLWTELWGDDHDGQMLVEPREAQVPQTRFDQKIFELRANPNTYCEPAADLDAFEKWGVGFDLDKLADECIEILSTHEPIAQLYERVVPNVIEEDIFWMRYFFARHLLEQEEERRKKLLERAESAVVEESNEDGWGDDDWGEDDTSAQPGKADEPINEGKNSDNTEVAEENTANQEEVSDKPDKDDKEQETNTEETNKSSEKVKTGATAAKTVSKPTEQTKSASTGEAEDDWGDDWE